MYKEAHFFQSILNNLPQICVKFLSQLEITLYVNMITSFPKFEIT